MKGLDEEEDDIFDVLILVAKNGGVLFEEGTITKENVNNLLNHEAYDVKINWLTIAVSLSNLSKKLVSKILEFEPNVLDETLALCHPIFFRLLLDYGVDVHKFFNANYYVTHNTHNDITHHHYAFVDYGIGTNEFMRYVNHPIAVGYAIRSDRCVQKCKGWLLTILYMCTRSAFRPVVEILLCAARQVWAMRGGEGCAPRGPLWGTAGSQLGFKRRK